MSDLEDYYLAGTIPGALKSMTANAGERQAEATKETNRILDEKYYAKEAYDRASSAKDLVDGLPNGNAKQIIMELASGLDTYTKGVLAGYHAGKTLDVYLTTAGDKKTKDILKDILVTMKDRSPENMNKWVDAIKDAKK